MGVGWTMTNKKNGAVEPCILVIFGATGDLTKRKLYPALYRLWKHDFLPEQFAVVAVGRRDKSSETVRREMSESVRIFADSSWNDEEGAALLERLSYFQQDFRDSQSYGELREFLATVDETYGVKGNRIFFLAVAPEYFGTISQELHEHRMAPNDGTSWQRVVIEKPFGQDLPSAIELNQIISSNFSETNIYRIDHYLSKEMAQNILVLRFANTLFEPLWNNRFIDHVQITLAETGGVNGRGPYYEQSGALRDMVQNHMLQLLTLVAMEPPVSLETDSVRDEKVKILRTLDFDTQAVVRGQYGEGTKNGQHLPAYVDEDRVSPTSDVETFVALKASIENFRWAGVPFYLRTGKRMQKKYSEIIIKFRKLPGVLYFKNDLLDSNVLVIRVQPDEGVYLKFNAKRPGTDQTIVPVTMDFCQNCMDGYNSPEAYERVLHDVLRGDSTLFTRWDEVEHSWRFVDKVSEHWKQSGSGVLTYPSGTWGPVESEMLLREDGRRWLYL